MDAVDRGRWGRPYRVVLAANAGGSSTQQSSLECARRHAHRSAERGDEMRWRRKADALRYFGDGCARLFQQCDRSLEPADNDVPMRCHTRLLTEGADEVIDAQTRGTGQLIQCGRRSSRVVHGRGNHFVYPTMSRTRKTPVRGPGRPAVAAV